MERSTKRRIAPAVLAATVLLASGCALGDLSRRKAEASPPPPPPPPPELTTPPSFGSTEKSITGSWVGTYTCNQGLTRLNLTLAQSSSGSVSGIFRFSPDSSNPSVPSGSYTVNGTLIGSSLRISGQRWIVRPSNYDMVGLRATVIGTRPLRISGQVDNPDCTSFTVQRS